MAQDINVNITNGVTEVNGVVPDINGVITIETGDIPESTDANFVSDAQLTVIGNTSGTNTGDQDLTPYATKSTPTFTGLTTLDTLKVTTGNYITPVDVVGIDVLGNVNRVSAANGRTALGLGTLATQSGTFSGTSSGTNTGDQDLSGYQVTLTATNLKTLVDTFTATTTPLDDDVVPITDNAGTTTKKLRWANFKTTLLTYFDTIFPRITVASTGSVISFNVPVIWNSPSSPSTANLTDDLTGAKIGYIQKIYHNKAVAPTVPAGWVLIGTGTYTTSTLNIIFAEWVSSTRVEYWITKPA
jgi:hypothetical protein